MSNPGTRGVRDAANSLCCIWRHRGGAIASAPMAVDYDYVNSSTAATSPLSTSDSVDPLIAVIVISACELYRPHSCAKGSAIHWPPVVFFRSSSSSASSWRRQFSSSSADCSSKQRRTRHTDTHTTLLFLKAEAHWTKRHTYADTTLLFLKVEAHLTQRHTDTLTTLLFQILETENKIQASSLKSRRHFWPRDRVKTFSFQAEIEKTRPHSRDQILETEARMLVSRHACTSTTLLFLKAEAHLRCDREVTTMDGLLVEPMTRIMNEPWRLTMNVYCIFGLKLSVSLYLDRNFRLAPVRRSGPGSIWNIIKT